MQNGQNNNDKREKLAHSIKQELEEYIRDSYESGYLKLPIEKELAEIFNVSRITIRSSLASFEEKGYIIRKQGLGTFINPEAMKIKSNLMEGLEFANLIENAGYESKDEVIENIVISPPEIVKESLQLNKDEKVFKISKVYYANQYPSIISIDYIPVKFFDATFDVGNTKLFSEDKSTFDMLYEYGNQVILRDRIEVESITEKESRKYLQNKHILKCDAVLLLKTVNFNDRNRPVLYTVEIHNTNFIKFDLLRVKNIY